MVISHKYRYIYIESPMTGSTAVAEELVLNYEGVRILRKHALPFELRKEGLILEDYFVFTNTRNPLDRIVSVYLKTLNNHNNKYSHNTYTGLLGKLFFFRMNRRYRKVISDSTFHEFIKDIPIYDEQLRLYIDQCVKVIRFETLVDDFAEVIKFLGLKLVRPLPVRNPTDGKKSFVTYYDAPHVKKEAIRKLGPYMSQSFYTFPPDWESFRPSLISIILFHLLGIFRFISWRVLRPHIAETRGV